MGRVMTTRRQQMEALAVGIYRPCTERGKGRIKRKKYIHPMKGDRK